ncbi:MAG: GAF domain-containing protein [Actinomycetota bacterium]|nr:GAF domain-containing protein [Actinomycetota bacterium]
MSEPPDTQTARAPRIRAGDDAAWSGILRQIIDLSAEEHNLRAMLRRVAELVLDATAADACFVHVVEHDSAEVVLMGASPAEFEPVVGSVRLPIGEGIAGWVAQRGCPALVEDKWNDPRYRYIPALRGEEFSSLVSVPLVGPHGVVGALNVHARRPRHFDLKDMEALSSVANLLAGIVENGVLYDRLLHREAELERFAARTIELQELDRRRIAADIHDGISQRLVSAWYHLKAAQSAPDTTTSRAEMEAVDGLLSDALDEARRAIVGLHPAVLDDLGLTAAITSVSASLGTDLAIDLDLAELELASHVEASLFRIVQEALQNVVKHASASRVAISLAAGAEGVKLAISDDGRGFDPDSARAATSYGLSGIHERARVLGASFELCSRSGDGTTLLICLPPAGESSNSRPDHRPTPAGSH